MTPGAADLGDDALADALADRGVNPEAITRLVADRETPFVATKLDTFLGDLDQ